MKVREQRVADIMTTPVITARKDMVLTEVIKLLLRWHISGTPVVDDENNLIGIISEHDIMNFALSGNAATTTVEEAMTREVVAFPPETDIETLVNCYASRRFRRVPIIKEGKVVGIVSRREILREMNRLYGD